MAITYISNSLITQGNLPLDARTVTTFDQMPNIEYPFAGMQVYVTEEESTYLINQDCLVSAEDGRFNMNPDINELRKHCVKITTSDNILEMIDGSAIIGPSGNSVIKRYCLGTKDAPNYSYDRMTLENQGWEINRPSITDEFGFVWSIEAIVTNNNTELVAPGWSETPLRENGVPGEQGVKGDPGLPGATTSVAYLDNPMDSVLLDADNNVTSGFPCSTNFYVYRGTESLKVTNLTWTASEELEPGSANVSYSDTYATLTVSKLPASGSAKVSFTLTATVNGVEYKAIYLINKISASAPNIVVDMANDNINIPCDSKGVISDGVLPLTNAINAFKAGVPMTVSSITTTTNGVECLLKKNSNTIEISSLPSFTNALTIDLNVTLNDGTNRVVSFRIIKVVPGAPGEAAVFYEIKPNIGYIKVLKDATIADSCKTLTAKVIKHIGSEITESDPSDFGMILYYNIDTDNIDESKTLLPAGLNLSNAITGNLDLDRYISLTLRRTSDQKIIDGPERIYMVKDGEQGPQGPQGPQGEQGIQGPSGADGESNYFHIAYANDASGNGYNQNGGDYVSTYVDSEINDVQSKFNAAGWRLFKGEQGEKGERGIAGAKGADGKTYYLHIAYANSADGSVDFSIGDATGRSYIGTYVDNIDTDSGDYHAYDWKKYVGDTAVIYRLVANNHTIKKDNVNGLKNTESIKVSILKIDGKTSSTLTVNQLSQETGDAYDIYKYTDGVSEQVTSDDKLIISTDEMGRVNDYIRYELVYTQTGSDNRSDLRDSVTIDVLYDGADGRIIYYDGEWVSGKTYTADDTSTPYVYDKTDPKGSNYFFLVRESYSGTVSPYNDWNTNNASDQHSWKPIPKFEAMYANVGMFDTATVGPAVFYKDWVFSQTDIDGGTSYNTFDGDPINGAFKPAIWFNFKTGQGSLANGQISWDQSGNVEFGPKVKLKWSSIEVEPVTAITAKDLGFATSGQYIRVDSEVTFKGETGWYLWVHENDLSNYETGVQPGDFIFAAFTRKAYDNTKVGNSCWAGSAVYRDGVWYAEEMDDTTVTSVVGGSDNLTASDVTDIIQKTEISGTQIKTGTLNASQITTGTLDASQVKVTNLDASNITAGKIGAGLIDVDNVVVSKLDTKPTQIYTTGKIKIENNDMIIYNRSTADPAIKISGDTLPDLSGTIPQNPENQQYIFEGVSTSTSTSSQSTTNYHKLGSITVDDNYDLTLSPEIPYNLALRWETDAEYRYHVNVGFGLNFVSSNQTNLFGTTMNFSFNTESNIGGSSGIDGTSGTLIPVIDGNSGYTLAKGKTYDIYEVYVIECEDVATESMLSIAFGFQQTDSTSLTNSMYMHYNYHSPTDRISELGSDGIRFRQSRYEYFETCGNKMIIQNGFEAMGFNANGLWIAHTDGDGVNSTIWSNPTVGSDGTLKFATSNKVNYQQIRSTMFGH